MKARVKNFDVEDNKKSHISKMKKQSILERCGFKVKRITFREWHIPQRHV